MVRTINQELVVHTAVLWIVFEAHMATWNLDFSFLLFWDHWSALQDYLLSGQEAVLWQNVEWHPLSTKIRNQELELVPPMFHTDICACVKTIVKLSWELLIWLHPYLFLLAPIRSFAWLQPCFNLGCQDLDFCESLLTSGLKSLSLQIWLIHKIQINLTEL